MTQRYRAHSPLLRTIATIAAIVITVTLGAFIDMLAEQPVPSRAQAATAPARTIG